MNHYNTDITSEPPNQKKGEKLMSTKLVRTSVTLLPEWEEDLKKLKQEKFYDKPKSELIRYLIQLGLEETKKPSKPA